MATSFFRFANKAHEPVVTWWPAVTATTYYQGDHLKVASNKAAVVASAADNLNFIGVCADDKTASAAEVPVIEAHGSNLDLEFEYGLDTATTCTIGNNLQCTGTSRCVAASDTDACFRITKTGTGASAKTVKCRMKSSLIFTGDAS